ncbi:hypothetical protein [Nonomuraea ceibae]|uniref:hypothetical protein n=1 Tax=Nonomuraea ceibae TaxID=1935170 RepID=UPI001C5DDDB0|nr:hypothetical protein [Nonomuraea ceibae]
MKAGRKPVALVLGCLLFLRRRRPLTVLLLSIAVLFAYHLGAWSTAGWIWPLSVAYVAAAGTAHVRWVAASVPPSSHTPPWRHFGRSRG